MANPVSVQVSPQIQHLIKHYDQQLKAQALRSGPGQPLVTTANWYEIFTKFVASATQIITSITGNPGDKRQAVIDAALAFYKQSIAPLLTQAVGTSWVFDTFIGPVIEREIPALAGGVYDALLAVFTRLSTPAPTTPTGTAGTGSGFAPY